jgi:hypothetical protein
MPSHFSLLPGVARVQLRTKQLRLRASAFLRERAPALGLSALVAMVATAAIPILKGRPLEESDFLVGVLALTTVYPVLRAAWYRDGDIFEPLPLISGMMFLYYVVRALFLRDGPVTSEDLAPNLRGDYSRFITPALELVVACWLSALAAYHLPIASFVARVVPPLPILQRGIHSRRLVVMLLVGLGVKVALLATHYGLGLRNGGTHDESTAGFKAHGTGLILTVLVIYAARSFTAARRPLNDLTLWGVIFPLCLFFGLLSAGKQAFIMPVVLVAIAYHYFRKRLGIRHIATILAVLVFVVVPLVVAYRQLDLDRETTVAESAQRAAQAADGFDEREDFWEGALIAGTDRFHGLDSAMLALKMTPDFVPWADGTLYGIFPALVVIPRIAWPEKPKMIALPNWGTDYWGVAYDYGSSFANTTIAALYCAFDFWGAALGFALHLIGLRTLYLWLRKTWSPLAVALYAGLIPLVLRIENDIPLLWGNMIQGSVVTLAVLWFVSEGHAVPASARNPVVPRRVLAR